MRLRRRKRASEPPQQLAAGSSWQQLAAPSNTRHLQPPAPLDTQMSMRPSLSTTSFTAASTASRSARSTCQTSARRDDLRTSSAVSAAPSTSPIQATGQTNAAPRTHTCAHKPRVRTFFQRKVDDGDVCSLGGEKSCDGPSNSSAAARDCSNKKRQGSGRRQRHAGSGSGTAGRHSSQQASGRR